MRKTIKITLLITVTLIVLLVASVMAGAQESRPIRLSIQTYPNKTVYGAFETFDPNGLMLRVTYEDGKESIIRSKDVSVSYQQDDCFRMGDGGVILSYGGLSVVMPITVNKINYDLESLSLDDLTVSYNGSYQSYNEVLPTLIGLDGIPLTMSAVGGSVDAGTYDITVSFHSDSKDYVIPDTRVVTMTILPASAEVVWGESTFIYDGKSKLPEAFYYDLNGNRITPTVTGSATNAGEYTAYARSNDTNYCLTGNSISYEIKKADYDFSSVVWSKDSFIYDGIKKSITVSGLPEGVSVIGYSSDIAVNAGKYTASVSLKYDERNYNPPPALTHTWEIKQAEYDMSTIRVLDAEYVYDGKIHYPTIEGGMPIGADGIALEYSFSGGACHVSEGCLNVTVSFTSKSKNYVIPQPITATVTIKPKGISVVWGDSLIPYKGEKTAPTAHSAECSITVDGEGINVGSYIATAHTDNTDYYVLNDRIDYEIYKEKNSWMVKPTVSTCYEGRLIKPVGEPAFGNPQYLYFADREGSKRITAPTLPGVYYVRIVVPETSNYYGIESELIEIKIVKIEAVSIECSILRNDLRAFEVLSAADILCYVINNDGSREKVDSSLLAIVYESGDSLRRADKAVTFVYKNMQTRAEVTVGYAEYDLSDVVWENVCPEYNGTHQSPYLSGLPNGISVIEYISPEMINAGSYEVKAVLSYDSENYNEPHIPECAFKILKKCVASPLIAATYNGQVQRPISDSPLYTLTSIGEYVDAGAYAVTAVLTDAENYIFENGEDSIDCSFVIQPKVIEVTVMNADKYLFEKVNIADYTLGEGIIEGDDLTVEQFCHGNLIFLRSTNPNYSLSVTPGKINRLWYPSRSGAVIIVIILLILALLGVAGVLLFMNRHRIINALAMLKCKWQNRTVVVSPPLDSLDEIENTVDKDESFDFDFSSIESFESEEQNDIEELDESVINELACLEVDCERADSLITDALAKSLIKKENDIVYTFGNGREVINVDTIGEHFASGERVDVNALKAKGLISHDTGYIKVLGRGRIDRALTVCANEFSLSAVKMIALTGGEAVKVATAREKSNED